MIINRFYVYNNSGGIDQVKKREITYGHQFFSSFDDMWHHFEEHIKQFKGANLTLNYWGYDDRIHSNVYAFLADITTAGQCYKQQMISFMIVEEK
jgi:hypothetical protein